MDINDIKRRAEGARTVHLDRVHTPGQPAQRFSFLLPTAHQSQVATQRCRVQDGVASSTSAGLSVLMVRMLLEQGLVGWSGVTEDDLAAGAGTAQADAPTPAAVALLLDADAARAAAIETFFIEALHARNVKQDAAAKN